MSGRLAPEESRFSDAERLWLSDRLEFRLPDFVRIAWASGAARAAWEPRFARIEAAWPAIEALSVVDGLRDCALLTAPAQPPPSPDPTWGAAGLRVEIWPYRGSAPTPLRAAVDLRRDPGSPRLHMAVGRGEAPERLRRAWQAGLHDEVGRLLGYPDCCRRFYSRFRAEAQRSDLLWPMAAASASAEIESRRISVAGPPATNSFWRRLGLQMIAHLPCRLDCPRSLACAGGFAEVGRRHGFGAEILWLTEILSWPVRFSVLHGLMEVVLPELKFTASTDATAEKFAIDWRLGSDRM